MRELRSNCCKAKYERLFPPYLGKEGSLIGTLYCKSCGEPCEVEEVWKRGDGKNRGQVMLKAENLARAFHETYEKLAPKYGYETQEETRVDWNKLPKNNKNLMIAVAQVIINEYLVGQDLILSV